MNYSNVNFMVYLLEIIPFWVEEIDYNSNNIKLVVKKKYLKNVIKFIKFHTNCKAEVLVDVFAVDNISHKFRFAVYYEFISIFFNVRLEIKCELLENEPIFSVTDQFKSANWLEREVWDLMGIFFVFHPDLRRILTDYGFMGFPLRKDFPLTGYEEIRYDDEKQRIVSEPVQLSQEFRFFEFKNPWKKTT